MFCSVFLNPPTHVAGCTACESTKVASRLYIIASRFYLIFYLLASRFNLQNSRLALKFIIIYNRARGIVLGASKITPSFNPQFQLHRAPYNFTGFWSRVTGFFDPWIKDFGP